MADDASIPSNNTAPLPQGVPNPPVITPRDFLVSFGEELSRALDLDTWRAGQDLSQEYSRIEAEVREAILREDALLQNIRRDIFPRLGAFADAPKGAGVFQAKTGDLERIHRGLLFNGGVEACDGTVQVHDTLPLTVYQIGVSLVSYRGDQGTWFQRLYRRDLRVTDRNPTEEVIELLERRERRGALNQPDRRDSLSELARRAIMAYAERAILLRRSEATWRMGHGNPAPYELLTGAGSLNLMIEATKVIRELVEGHRKFVFVASEPSDRVLLTIGQALRPLEYAIVDTLHGRIARIVENGHYRIDPKNVTVDNTWDGERLMPEAWIKRFRDEVAPQVVVGIFRATRLAPAQVFYAHIDHADVAAHIVLADSVLQEHRGFPLLIDLADHVCSAVFGSDSLAGLVNTAYAKAGVPWRYSSERQTRSR